MFIFKKIIAATLMPLPLGLIILITGLILLFFSKKQLTGKMLMAAGTFWILFFSSPWIGQSLLKPLEHAYSPPVQTTTQYIHVLGAGLYLEENLPLSSKLSHSALERTIEGVRLHQLNPHSRLIFSGYGATSETTTATLNSQMALMLGVNKAAMEIFTQPRDTAEEAQALKNYLVSRRDTDAKVILVTSASHMPRAMGSFIKAGINAIAAPVDYKAKTAAGFFNLPQSRGLAQSETAFYEIMGRLLYWLKD